MLASAVTAMIISYRRGRTLTESFVVTAEGISFGKGTSGVDMT